MTVGAGAGSPAPAGAVAHAGATPPSVLRWRVLQGTLFVVVSACSFGSIAPLTIVATRNGATLASVQAWRFGSAALILAIVAALARQWARRRAIPGEAPSSRHPTRAWYHPGVLAIAGGGQASVATLSLLSVETIPAATMSFLFYTFPVWVTIITVLRRIERVTAMRLVALVVALTGIAAMIGAPDAASLHPLGVTYALAGAVVYGAFVPVLGVLQQGRQPLDIARAIATGGAVIFIVWALATGGVTRGLGVPEFLASIAQGVLSTTAFLGFLAGLRILGPVRSAITSTAEPFWTALLGVLMLSQPLTLGTLLGGSGIVVAVVLLMLPERPTRPADAR